MKYFVSFNLREWNKENDSSSLSSLFFSLIFIISLITLYENANLYK